MAALLKWYICEDSFLYCGVAVVAALVTTHSLLSHGLSDFILGVSVVNRVKFVIHFCNKFVVEVYIGENREIQVLTVWYRDGSFDTLCY